MSPAIHEPAAEAGSRRSVVAQPPGSTTTPDDTDMAGRRSVAAQPGGSTTPPGDIAPGGSTPSRPSSATSSGSPSYAATSALPQQGSRHGPVRPSSPLPGPMGPSEHSSRAPSLAGTGLLMHESSPPRTNIGHSSFKSSKPGPDSAKRTSRRYTLLLALPVIVLVVAAVLFGVKIAWPSPLGLSNACATHACHNYAKRLLSSVNRSVSPCHSFTRFVCDGWQHAHELTVWEEQFGGDVLDRLTTVLRSIPVPATGQNEEQQAATLYRSCRQVLRGTSDQLSAVKEALLDAGIVWPRPSLAADALHTLFYSSLRLGWDALLNVAVKLSGEVAFLALGRGRSLPLLFLRDLCSKEASTQRDHFEFFKRAFQEDETSNGTSYEDVSAYDCYMMTKLSELDPDSDWSSPTSAEIIPTGTNISKTRWAAVSNTFNLSLSTPLQVWIDGTNYTETVFSLWVEHGEDTFHLFLSWCTVQVAALYSNRNLVLNYFGRNPERARVYHGAFCLSRAVFFSRRALFARYNSEVLGGGTKAIARELTMNLRRSFFHRLSNWDHFDEGVIVLGNWSSLTAVFRIFEPEKEKPKNVSDFKRDMKNSSFVSNWQNSVHVNTTAEVDEMLNAVYALRYTINANDECDFQLMPYSLSYPLFDAELPTSINYGGFGSQVVAVIGNKFVRSYLSANASLVKPMLDCMRLGPFGNGTNLMFYAAAVVGLRALVDGYKNTNYISERPLPGLEQYTGLQTLFMAYCYSICGGSTSTYGEALCNLALQYVPEFSEAFNCTPGEPLNPLQQCRLF